MSSFYLRRLASPWSQPLVRFYSVNALHNSRKKWGVEGLPRPRSLLDDHETPVDLSEDDDTVNGARPDTPPLHSRRPSEKPTPSQYKAHRYAMKKNFPEGWSPPRKLSREAMEGIRQMYRMGFTTPILAEKFKISSEAVRRILKSKWEPPREKRLKMAERERLEKEAYFKLNRERERIEAHRASESSITGNGRDKLTFQ